MHVLGLGYDEWWRLFNVVTLSYAAGLVIVAAVRRWRAWTARMRMLAQAMLLMIMTLLVASIENLVQGNPIGARVFLTTVAAAWVIWSQRLGEGYERRRDC